MASTPLPNFRISLPLSALSQESRKSLFESADSVDVVRVNENLSRLAIQNGIYRKVFAQANLPFPEMTKLGTFKIPIKRKAVDEPLTESSPEKFKWNIDFVTAPSDDLDSNASSIGSSYANASYYGGHHTQRSVLMTPYRLEVEDVKEFERLSPGPPTDAPNWDPYHYHGSDADYFAAAAIQDIKNIKEEVSSVVSTVRIERDHDSILGIASIKQEVFSEDETALSSGSLERTPPLPRSEKIAEPEKTPDKIAEPEGSPHKIPEPNREKIAKPRFKFHLERELISSDSDEDEVHDEHKRNIGHCEKRIKLESQDECQEGNSVKSGVHIGDNGIISSVKYPEPMDQEKKDTTSPSSGSGTSGYTSSSPLRSCERKSNELSAKGGGDQNENIDGDTRTQNLTNESDDDDENALIIGLDEDELSEFF